MRHQKIKTSCIVEYTIANRKTEMKEESLENLTKAHTSDFITSKTRKTYTNRIEAFTECVRYTKSLYSSLIKNYNIYVSFVTLTLPSTQLEEDKDNKRNLLNNFLIYVQRYYDVKIYCWKAEKQGNGNIHYHIMLDRFIKKEELRELWEGILVRNGYILKESEDKMQKSFSTWIVAVADEAALKKYICKYMTKQDDYERAGIEGRKMGCSDSMRKLAMFSTTDFSIMNNFISIMLLKSWIKADEREYCTIYLLDYQVFNEDIEAKINYMKSTTIKGKHRTVRSTNIDTCKLIKNYDPTLYEILCNYYAEQIELIYS